MSHTWKTHVTRVNVQPTRHPTALSCPYVRIYEYGRVTLSHVTHMDSCHICECTTHVAPQGIELLLYTCIWIRTCHVESFHTHRWLMSHMWMNTTRYTARHRAPPMYEYGRVMLSHVTHMDDPCHICELTLHVTHQGIELPLYPYIWIRTCHIEPCHTHTSLMSNLWMNTPLCTPRYQAPRIYIYIYEHGWVMLGHVTRLNASYHI